MTQQGGDAMPHQAKQVMPNATVLLHVAIAVLM